MEIEKGIDILNSTDLEKVQSLLSDLVEPVVDGKPGIKEADYIWLRESRKNHKMLVDSYGKNGISKAKTAKLEEAGLFKINIPRNEAIVTFELLDALYSTFNFIKSIHDNDDTKNLIDEQGLTRLQVEAATKANIEIADFFIKTEKCLKLPEDQMHEIFNKLFNETGLEEKELNKVGIKSFPTGTLAMISSYYYVKSEWPEWNVRVPNVEQDMEHAVDLISELKEGSDTKEINYYQVKGSKNISESVIEEITTVDQMRKIESSINEKLNTLGQPENRLKQLRGLLKSLYNIHDYSKKQQSKNGGKIKAFWIEVPIREVSQK